MPPPKPKVLYLASTLYLLIIILIVTSVRAAAVAAAAKTPGFSWRRAVAATTGRSRSSNDSITIIKMSNILESPSAERNKGPIADVLASEVYPDLVERIVNRKDGGEEEKGERKLRVLELAAGCGVHTTHFVTSFLSSPLSVGNNNDDDDEGDGEIDVGVEWHPSDPDADARASIDARASAAGLLGERGVVPANGWILGTSGGTACNDGGHRDRSGDAGAGKSGRRGGDDDGTGAGSSPDYERYGGYFDLITCINMIHIAPFDATLGLMECAGKVLKRGGRLMCYGPYKVGGTAVESNLRFDESLRSRDPSWGLRNLEDVIEVAKKEGLEFEKKVEMPANNLSVLFRKV